jgi:hypothetical protein
MEDRMDTKVRTPAALFCLLVLGASTSIAAPPAAGDARAVLSLAVTALGGEKAFDAVKSYQVRVDRSVRSSVDGVKYVTLDETFRAPDSLRKEAEIKLAGRGPYVTRTLQVFDGSEGWSNENEKHEMLHVDGGSLQRVRKATLPRFGLLRRAARGEIGATLLGRQTLEGREVDQVRVDVPDAKLVYLIDVETRRPARVALEYEGMTETVSLDDYRTVGGLTLPFRVVTDSRGPGETEYMEDRLTDLRVNPVVPDASFAAPSGR